MERFLGELGIEHWRTALYHPQANGAGERFNRVITDAVRLARVEQRSVADALFACVSAYRATPQATTGKSPAELMIGRKLALPLDRLTRGSQKAGRLNDSSIQDHVSKQKRRQKWYFDKRNNVESQT